uniref:Putative secreted protein n=1 Tax=Anopheles darlingi TaxID=43151 RepID=A0A2M4DKM8_ANODA
MKWRNICMHLLLPLNALNTGEHGHDEPTALPYCSFVSSIASDAFFQLSKSLSNASIIGFGPRISTSFLAS